MVFWLAAFSFLFWFFVVVVLFQLQSHFRWAWRFGWFIFIAFVSINNNICCWKRKQNVKNKFAIWRSICIVLHQTQSLACVGTHTHIHTHDCMLLCQFCWYCVCCCFLVMMTTQQIYFFLLIIQFGENRNCIKKWVAIVFVKPNGKISLT